MKDNIYLYILVMALVTYLVRMLPLAILKKEIKSRFFKSFLYYVPYVTLSVMIFPAILSSTSSLLSASVGFAVALLFSFFQKSLFTVSIFACISVYLVEWLQAVLQ